MLTTARERLSMQVLKAKSREALDLVVPQS